MRPSPTWVSVTTSSKAFMEIPISKEQEEKVAEGIDAINSQRAKDGRPPIDAPTWLAQTLGAAIDQMHSRAQALTVNAVTDAFVKLPPEEQKKVTDILKIPPAHGKPV